MTLYTRTAFINNERHEEVKDALLMLTADFKLPGDGGIDIRVDAAPAFQRFSRDPILHQHGIILVIGNVKNANKNPMAE